MMVIFFIAFKSILFVVYLLSIGLLIIVIINPSIGVNNIHQKIDFPYPIFRFEPKYCPIKWLDIMCIIMIVIQV